MDDQPSRNETDDEPVDRANTSEDESFDDPLSDIWVDEGTVDGDSTAVTPPPTTSGEIVEIKTVSGTYRVDLTPPDVQAKNAEVMVGHLYRKKTADECLRAAVRQLTLTRIVDGDSKPWKLAACHATIAKIYWNLKNYPDQTLDHATNAQRLLSFPNRSSEKPDKMELLDTALLATYLRGKAMLAMRKFEEAAEELEKAEQLLEERRRRGGGSKDKGFWVIEISTAMARVRMFENDTSDALRYLRKVEKVMQKRYGADGPKMIPVYQEIAKLEENLGRAESAIELRMKAYTIAKAGSDQRNVQIGEAALELARVYARARVEDAEVYAETYFTEAVACFSEASGSTHPRTLIAQQELAAELTRMERTPEAIALLTQCLRRLTAAGEEYDSKSAKVYKQLAELCADSGRNRQAVQFLKKCLQVEEMHYGPKSKKLAATKEALAALSKNLNGRGQSLDARPRFSATIRTSTIEGGRKYSWDD